MKDAILTLAVTVFLIVIFSTMGAPGAEAQASTLYGGGAPTQAGEFGVVVETPDIGPAEVERQPEPPEETTPAEPVADPEAAGVVLSDDQRATCNLVAVFLAGAASVLFVEIIVQAKKEETT